MRETARLLAFNYSNGAAAKALEYAMLFPDGHDSRELFLAVAEKLKEGRWREQR